MILSALIAATTLQTAPSFECVAASPDGKLIAAGNSRGQVYVWDFKTGAVQKQLEAGDAVRSITFTPDSDRLLAGTDADEARGWMLRDDYKQFGSFKTNGNVTAIAVDSKQRWLALGTETGGNTHIYELSNSKLKRTFTQGNGGVFALTFSPDAKFLFAAGSKMEQYDIGKLGREPAGLDQSQEELLAQTQRAHVATLGAWHARGIGISKSGKFMFGAASQAEDSDKADTLMIWRAPFAKPINVLRAPTEWAQVSVDPAGTRAAACSYDGTVVLWVNNGNMWKEGMGLRTTGVAVIPKSKNTAISLHDGTVRILSDRLERVSVLRP